MIPPIPRFDGAAEWAKLHPGQRDAIGAIALELAAGWRASQVENGPGRKPSAIGRAADEAVVRTNNSLVTVALNALWSSALLKGGRSRIPSLIGPICRACGCSERDPCRSEKGEPCGWAEPDLCTACAPAAEAAA